MLKATHWPKIVCIETIASLSGGNFWPPPFAVENSLVWGRRDGEQISDFGFRISEFWGFRVGDDAVKESNDPTPTAPPAHETRIPSGFALPAPRQPAKSPEARRLVINSGQGIHMVELDRITFDPAVMGGRACIRGMRVTVGTIVGLVASGHSTGDILEAYPYLEEEDIRQALTYSAWRASEMDLPYVVPN